MKEEMSQKTNQIELLNKAVKYIGMLLILIAVFIPIFMPSFVYPVIDEMGMDTIQYALETNVNLVRYMGLALFLLVIGITCLILSRSKHIK
ncbi:hypothetical protein ACFP65_07990 [Marinilactibacillus sp. GCM10026970]|uniref:hypothetical protein n=1 Tax=Marinilactibacillus sp. GCM10026970 TaxID=3252642 RepID=UPI0036195455